MKQTNKEKIIRTFVAISLPGDIISFLKNIQDEIKKKPKIIWAGIKGKVNRLEKIQCDLEANNDPFF